MTLFNRYRWGGVGRIGHVDLLGSAAFLPVQNDIKGNIAVSWHDHFRWRPTFIHSLIAFSFDEIQKVRARYDAAPALSGTLEKLVENEKGEKKRTATEGLMWLLRGLSFTCKALQNSQSNKAQELSAAFTSSYENTLKKFHGILVRPIFAVSCTAFLRFFLAGYYHFLPPATRGGEGPRRHSFISVDLPQPFFCG